jgi:hypothetical protein
MANFPTTRLTNQRRDFPAVLGVALIFSIIICAGLYFYYLIAQNVVNPMPVQGVLKEAKCRPSAVSRQGAQTEIPVLLSIYEFPSRSKDVALGSKGRPHLDQITEYVSYETNAECQAAAFGQEVGSKRTIWAGENPLSDRFRARLIEEREYPSSTLLWVPGCIAALIFWGWRRAMR